LFSATALIWTVALVCPHSLRADPGELSVFVHEPASDAPLACRAWVEAGGERFFEPVTESSTPYKKDGSFSCNGRFVINVPAGKATIHVERGKEYLPVDKEVQVKKDEVIQVDITLKRWIHMVKGGWYSADMHCHFGVKDVNVLKQLALADDVDFEPVLTLWNQRADPNREPGWPERFEGTRAYADPTHLVTFHNQEIERIGGEPFESLGALLISGLTDPVEMPLAECHYPCDAFFGEMAKADAPHCVIDTDKPMWAENVVGVALGLFDSVQICHNHYHRESTIGVCCGMATDDTTKESENWGEDEIFHLTNLTYYRFLNCGFRLAVTGGSAMDAMAWESVAIMVVQILCWL